MTLCRPSVALATTSPSHCHPFALHCCCSAFVLFFFIIRTYLARLTGIAAVPTYETAIPSWNALTASGVPVAYVPGSAADAWIHSSTAPFLTDVWPQLVAYPNETAAAQAVRDGAVPAMLTESCTAKYLALIPPCLPDQRLVPVVDPLVSIGLVGFAYMSPSAMPANAIVPPVSPATAAALDAGVIDINMYGGFQQLEDTYTVAAPGNCNSQNVIEPQPLRPTDLQAVFITFAIVFAVTMVQVAIERHGGPARFVRDMLAVARRLLCGCCGGRAALAAAAGSLAGAAGDDDDDEEGDAGAHGFSKALPSTADAVVVARADRVKLLQEQRSVAELRVQRSLTELRRPMSASLSGSEAAAGTSAVPAGHGAPGSGAYVPPALAAE